MPTFFDKGACIFFCNMGAGAAIHVLAPQLPLRMHAAHSRAIRLLARSPGMHDLPERVKMATSHARATESAIPNHSCKLCSRRLKKLSS